MVLITIVTGANRNQQTSLGGLTLAILARQLSPRSLGDTCHSWPLAQAEMVASGATDGVHPNTSGWWLSHPSKKCESQMG